MAPHGGFGAGSPRLTAFLRYHSTLSLQPQNNEEDYNLAEILSLKREEKWKHLREQGACWANIMHQTEELSRVKGVTVDCYIREVAEVARLISPELDTRDEVSALLLRVSYNKNVLLNKDKMMIRSQVGVDVKPSLLERAHKAVRKIVDLLGEDFIEKVDELQKPAEEEPMFGAHIKVGHVCQQPTFPKARKLVNLVKNRNIARMSLNFEDYKVDEDVPSESPAMLQTEETYDKSWIKAEMLKGYSDSTVIPELANGVYALLLGGKTNQELESELFDLLGFERFELIQSLLQHRNDVSSAQPSKEERYPSLIENLEKRVLCVRPSFGSQVLVMHKKEKLLLKQAQKEEKRMIRAAKSMLSENGNQPFNPEELKLKREKALIEASQIRLFQKHTRAIAEPHYPYVFDSTAKAKQMPGYIAGQKLFLPDSVRRTVDQEKEEIDIPQSDPVLPNVGSKLLPITSMDEIGQIAFGNCDTLNRIQTIVYPVAYHTNENLLICAPTGAGKTNIAMLTVVHQIRLHIENGVILRDKFKIVYVAPMKALAAEMTKNFGKRLEPLGLLVRELTGDMHLTKSEIMATNMIITTPEKWDVITRKPGDTQLAQLVKLLIIDEVHLLHGDRGPVLESLVARTLRMVESLQSMIRIVGLSATLPNYLDVAGFLRVNPYKGLFFFDGRFRPVPLGLSFVGVKGLGRLQQMEQMDRVAFDKCLSFVKQGHQVMVFVHARNGTLRTAENLIKIAQDMGRLREFMPPNSSALMKAKKDITRAKSKKIVELFDYGFSVHHAGLPRNDRTLVENLFSHGCLTVLVCTATLAWGVNLPAHAVIIRGTEIYDSKYGQMVDIGILDVLQIFGRAGRPQFDSDGHGTIITTHDKLAHYLSLLTDQYPIESSFVNHLADNLNAEVALGTVTNIEEAIEWLSYTYLYVRMKKNPQVYGLTYMEAQRDPTLAVFRRELLVVAARKLDMARMVRYEESTGYLHITDLGRIASQYYIKYDTVEVFNEFLKQVLSEDDILALISQSSEFTQLKVREEEMNELDELHQVCEYSARGGVENVHGKVNILLQSYISQAPVEGFSLVSDMNYVTENSVRIARALFEVVLHKSWPILAGRLLNMALMLEHRMWNFESPLKQFGRLSYEILTKIEEKRMTIEKIRDMDSKEIGEMIRHQRMGKEVCRLAWNFPLLHIETTVQPITRTVLRVCLDIEADFKWNDHIHGTQEVYWIWVEDPETSHMYHHEHFILTKKQVVRNEPQELVFTIPIFDPMPPQYYVRALSDKWLGCESYCVINFQHLILPETHPPHTDLLNLHPLPVKSLNNTLYESLYKFTHFNPIQTQVFHCLYHTDNNVLLGAPTGSGKTIAAEIAIFKVFRHNPGTKVVYIAPMKALVRERVEDWQMRLGEKLGKTIVELTGDVTPDVRAIQRADIIITTPEKWDGISRSWQTRNYVKQVSLIVIDEIHLLGESRGPVLEVIVSRTNFISSHTNRTLRIIGLSTALANAKDLADWLGIREMGLYNFRPSVRPVPLEVHIAGFPGKHYCPRMATMNKPTFQAIKQHSPDKPVLVFVSSRRQTRLTALDLMGFVVTEENPKQWLRMEEHELDQLLSNVKDENLRLCLSFGVGLHHAGLVERDRKLVEELFVHQKIQLLITTATLAWGVNFPAHLVVIKGTEYYDGKTRRYVDFPITDVLQMMGRAGRPQYDDHGVAVILVHDQKKHFYKKFLYEPFPVESSLLAVLPDHLNAEIVAGTINTKQEALDYLTWTYFFRRLTQNPSYYGLEISEGGNGSNCINRFLSAVVDKTVSALENSYCIEVAEDNRTVVATPLGRIASFYYLTHQTVQLFQDKLHADISIEEMLELLTQVHEYAQIPVRHNEDNVNAELAKICPLDVNPYTYDSSHTKAHLLLQAHLSRLPLPSVDYLTDTKSVLDQAIRILQAMVDVCACAGWLACTLQAQTLIQMVTQARWHKDSTVLTLPFVDPSMLYCFKYREQSLLSLPQLIHAVGDKYETLASMLREELEEGQIEIIFRVLKQYPVISVQLELATMLDYEEQTFYAIHTRPFDCDDTIEWIQVKANQEYSLSVVLTRTNYVRDLKVHAPKFPKPKDEGWFIVVGHIDCGELLALKRSPPVRKSATHTLTFQAPCTTGRTYLTAFIMSDSYLGLDQQYDIPIEVIECNHDDRSGASSSAIDEEKCLPASDPCFAIQLPDVQGLLLESAAQFPALPPHSVEEGFNTEWLRNNGARKRKAKGGKKGDK